MALEIDIVARNLEVTERIKGYVTKKVSKLDRFLNGIDETRVDLAYVKSARSAADRHVAQITLRGKGYILRTEERADDLYRAIDSSVDKMQRQIERYKGKRFQPRGDGTSVTDVTSETSPVDEAIEGPVIAKRKRFSLVPMDELEAIDQMILLGHESFFVFYNANSNAINVLYRRRDGSYGLIEPEIS